MTVSDFVGTYRVRTANLGVPLGWSYAGPSVVVGQTVVIASNGQDQAIVTINGQDFDFNWSDASRTLQRSFDVTATPPGTTAEFLPALNQISLIESGRFKAIYAASTAGDPQQVGIWGADNGGG